LSLQARAETAGERDAQIRAPHLDVDDAMSFHDWRELAPDGFDFWKLRHGQRPLRTRTANSCRRRA